MAGNYYNLDDILREVSENKPRDTDDFAENYTVTDKKEKDQYSQPRRFAAESDMWNDYETGEPPFTAPSARIVPDTDFTIKEPYIRQEPYREERGGYAGAYRGERGGRYFETQQKPVNMAPESAPAYSSRTAVRNTASNGAERFDSDFEERLILNTKNQPETYTSRVKFDIPEPERVQRNSNAAAARKITNGITDDGQADEEDIPVRNQRYPKQKAAPVRKAAAPVREQGNKKVSFENISQTVEYLKNKKNKLGIALFINALMLLLIVYLAAAPGAGLPMPGFLSLPANLSLYLWISEIAVVISALACGPAIGNGIMALITLKPDADSYCSAAVLACLVQGSYTALNTDVYTTHASSIYLPLAAIMLLFNTVGKLIDCSRLLQTSEMCTVKGEKGVSVRIDDMELTNALMSDLIDDVPSAVCFVKTDKIDSFSKQALSKSRCETISKIICPIAFAAALVMAVLSYFLGRDVFTAACIFTAALCITSPIGGSIACGLPLMIANKRLTNRRACIAGYDAVEELGGVNGVVLRCSDIFPASSVVLHGMKVFHKKSVEETVTVAASILCSCDSTLTGIFKGMVSDISELREVESITYEDLMGISAWVDGQRVLIGSRDIMRKYGIAMPSQEFERELRRGNKRLLYLSVAGELSAVYILSYSPNKGVRRAMSVLADHGYVLCVHSTDPNVTEDMICEIYDVPRDAVKVIPDFYNKDVESYLSCSEKAKPEIVYFGSIPAFARALIASRNCRASVTAESLITLMSILIGFALVTFFAFNGAIGALAWTTIAVYQAFWVLLTLLIPLVRH